jgi:iron complex transport system ATP-binding protein
MIEAREVGVSIGHTPILRDAHIRVQPGEVTAVVGPNGSGKTTFLRALSADIGHTGAITINGREIGRLKPWEAASKRAVLPQQTVLTFPFTVREVVRLGLIGGRSGADDAAQLPDRALARVDLEGFAGRFYQELSGGEQQRVQLARVLCQVWSPVLDGEPRYLLLDEPVSSLDIKHQLIIMNIARDFAAQGGGVVAILHDLNLTAMYADRVYVMHRGRVAADGAPRDVLTDAMLGRVFDCALRVGVLPQANIPFVLPQSAA